MGLALCHSIPRDRAIRLVYLLGLIAFTLLLAGLAGGRSAATDGMVWATARYPDSMFGANNSKIFAIIRGWEIRTLDTPTDSESGIATASTSPLCPFEDRTVFNNRALSGYSIVGEARTLCNDKFLPAGWASTSMFIVSCCTLFLFWLFFSCLGGHQSITKNTVVFVAVLVLSGIPTLAAVVGCIVFNEIVMGTNPDVVPRLLRLAFEAHQFLNLPDGIYPQQPDPSPTTLDEALTFSSSASMGPAEWMVERMTFVSPTFAPAIGPSFILLITATALLCLMSVVTVAHAVVSRREGVVKITEADEMPPELTSAVPPASTPAATSPSEPSHHQELEDRSPADRHFSRRGSIPDVPTGVATTSGGERVAVTLPLAESDVVVTIPNTLAASSVEAL